MNYWRLLPFLGGSLAIGVFSSFNNFSLSLWLGGYAFSYGAISLLSNTRGFMASFVSPLAGGWSDKTWLGWLGRRRPFILFFGLTAALLMAVTPMLSRLGAALLPSVDPVAAAQYTVIAVLVLVTVVFNLMDDIHKALLIDLTTARNRNTLAGFATFTDMSGQFLILGLGAIISNTMGGGVPDLTFLVAGGIIAAGILLTVFGVREPSPRDWQGGHEPKSAGPRISLRDFVTRYTGALILGAVVFTYWFGVNGVLPLISVYLRDEIHASDGEAQLLPAVLLGSTALMAVPMALLGNRIGKRRVIGLGYSIMLCAAFAGMVITTREQAAIVFLLTGIGNAAYMALTIPLLGDLVPRNHMGTAAGLIACAGGVSGPVSAMAAGAAAEAYGPRAIFAVMAAGILVALVLLTQIRRPSELAGAASAAKLTAAAGSSSPRAHPEGEAR